MADATRVVVVEWDQGIVIRTDLGKGAAATERDDPPIGVIVSAAALSVASALRRVRRCISFNYYLK